MPLIIKTLTERQTSCSDCQANQMLVKRKRVSLDDSASELNHQALNNKREDYDEKEISIVKEAFEDVKFLWQNLSAVNFVKDLH